jgi:hypothetical protein
VLILFVVESLVTPNDAGGGVGGGENRHPLNGEAQDQNVSQDAEMEEGNSG